MTASPSPSAPLRLLAVHAHPDDESSKGAATMAMYAAAGVDVLVATCTDGSRGDIQNPAMEGQPHPKRDMAGRPPAGDGPGRPRSSASASAGWALWIPGCRRATPCRRCRPAPSPLQPLERAAAPLVRLVRDFRPHVILSYDENGGYPHPDHIMAHRVAVEAFEAAGDPARYPGTGEPWEPSKLYYDRAFSPDRFRALHFALEEAGLQSPYAERLAAWLEADAEGPHPAGPDAPHHHPGRVRRLLRSPRRGAPLAPHPGGPGGILLRGLRGDAAPDLALGGLLPDPVPDPGRTAGNGPLRRAKIEASPVEDEPRRRQGPQNVPTEGSPRAFLAPRPATTPAPAPRPRCARDCPRTRSPPACWASC